MRSIFGRSRVISRCRPGFDAALQVADSGASLAQRFHNVLAHFAAMDAVGDERTACGQRFRPRCKVIGIASQGSREHLCRFPERLAAAYIDHDRRLLPGNFNLELRNRNGPSVGADGFGFHACSLALPPSFTRAAVDRR